MIRTQTKQYPLREIQLDYNPKVYTSNSFLIMLADSNFAKKLVKTRNKMYDVMGEEAFKKCLNKSKDIGGESGDIPQMLFAVPVKNCKEEYNNLCKRLFTKETGEYGYNSFDIIETLDIKLQNKLIKDGYERFSSHYNTEKALDILEKVMEAETRKWLDTMYFITVFQPPWKEKKRGPKLNLPGGKSYAICKETMKIRFDGKTITLRAGEKVYEPSINAMEREWNEETRILGLLDNLCKPTVLGYEGIRDEYNIQVSARVTMKLYFKTIDPELVPKVRMTIQDDNLEVSIDEE